LSSLNVSQIRGVFNLSPIYVKLVGTFDELALLNMHKEELAAARGGGLRPPARMGGCVWRSSFMLASTAIY